MVPSIYGENMFDDFFDGSFFGGHSPLFGKHASCLLYTSYDTARAGGKPKAVKTLPAVKQHRVLHV